MTQPSALSMPTAASIEAALTNLSTPVQAVDISLSGKDYYALSSGHDAVFFSSAKTTQQRLYVDGGSDVSIIGVDLKPTSGTASSSLYLKNTAGSAKVIGVHIDNSAIGERDAIGLDGNLFQPDVTIIDTAVENVNGSYAGFHGDVLQVHSRIGALTLDGFSGTTNYQGIFLGGDANKTPESVAMNDVYLGMIAGPNKYPVLLWLGGGKGADFGTKLNNVFLDSEARGRGQDFATVVYQGAERLSGDLADETVSYTSGKVEGSIAFAQKGSVAAIPTAANTGVNYDTQAALATTLGVASTRSGTAGSDTLTSSGSQAIFAGAGNDTLIGGSGNDYLSGDLGADSMKGGLGDDVYVVDNAWDSIVEAKDAGRDAVLSSISLVLGQNVEDLVLTGASASTGTGNALANTISGNTAANLISGLAGDDMLFGYEGADTLVGGEGQDVLNGGTGVDSMTGEAGNDTYVVDALGDVVMETNATVAGGIDTVISYIDYTLGKNVERLVLTGSAINGTGNALDNLLQGNDAANLLWGGAGNDVLTGGLGSDTLDAGWGSDILLGGSGADSMIGHDGDDIFTVDNVGDVIVEWINNGKGGNDTAVSSVDHMLAANVENLALTGDATNGTGNTQNNVLKGSAANNILNGLAGNDTINGGQGADTLYGGAGKDVFIFRAGEAAGDRVLDFAKGDKLVLEGYGSGAYASRSGTDLIVHWSGGTETIGVHGSVFGSADWYFQQISQNIADMATSTVAELTY
jgi:Ca2+-binding RTX toxin-like protein